MEDAERYFGSDQYKDATAARPPVIYIAPNDIYSVHSVIADSIDVLVPEDCKDDPLRTIIRELGGAPSGGSTELGRARAEEVALTLSARVRAQDGSFLSSSLQMNVPLIF